MRFLIDASLPHATRALIERYGIEAEDVRDSGGQLAEDRDSGAYARRAGYSIITSDLDFADIRVFPPAQFAGIVVLRPPRYATTTITPGLIEAFLRNSELVARIPGTLLILEEGQTRLYQP